MANKNSPLSSILYIRNIYFIGIMVIILRSKVSENTEGYFLGGRKLPYLDIK